MSAKRLDAAISPPMRVARRFRVVAMGFALCGTCLLVLASAWNISVPIAAAEICHAEETAAPIPDNTVKR